VSDTTVDVGDLDLYQAVVTLTKSLPLLPNGDAVFAVHQEIFATHGQANCRGTNPNLPLQGAPGFRAGQCDNCVGKSGSSQGFNAEDVIVTVTLSAVWGTLCDPASFADNCNSASVPYVLTPNQTATAFKAAMWAAVQHATTPTAYPVNQGCSWNTLAGTQQLLNRVTDAYCSDWSVNADGDCNCLPEPLEVGPAGQKNSNYATCEGAATVGHVVPTVITVMAYASDNQPMYQQYQVQFAATVATKPGGCSTAVGTGIVGGVTFALSLATTFAAPEFAPFAGTSSAVISLAMTLICAFIH
jgi:hypothetical protein